MMEITFLNSGFQFFSEGECPLTPSSPGTLSTTPLYAYYTYYNVRGQLIQSPELRLLRKVYKGQQVI